MSENCRLELLIAECDSETAIRILGKPNSGDTAEEGKVLVYRNTNCISGQTLSNISENRIPFIANFVSDSGGYISEYVSTGDRNISFVMKSKSGEYLISFDKGGNPSEKSMSEVRKFISLRNDATTRITERKKPKIGNLIENKKLVETLSEEFVKLEIKDVEETEFFLNNECFSGTNMIMDDFRILQKCILEEMPFEHIPSKSALLNWIKKCLPDLYSKLTSVGSIEPLPDLQPFEIPDLVDEVPDSAKSFAAAAINILYETSDDYLDTDAEWNPETLERIGIIAYRLTEELRYIKKYLPVKGTEIEKSA